MKTIKPIFEETEINTYSQTEKLKFIFEKLITYLSPIETSKQRDWTNDPGHNNVKRWWTIYFAECIFRNKDNIKIPFADISLDITEEMITINSENFRYEFAPEQILTMYKRIKKIKNTK